MSKLIFRYGTVNSAKTLNLLAVAHNYEEQGKSVLTIVPAIDTRHGTGIIKTRAGLKRQADVIITKPGDILRAWLNIPELPDCVLVDEAQFLDAEHISELRHIALHIPVICYGLKADFKGQLFPGSKRLLEVADAIEEIKTVCWYCTSKAIMNLKIVDDQPVFDGPSVDLGGNELYRPVCWSCYDDIKETKSLP